MTHPAHIVVVGAGGAGMMAAIAAARAGASVTLLEKTKRVGYKIIISGKGRCNITNAEPSVKELVQHYPGGGRFLWSLLSRFDTQDAVRFFEDLGVKTKRDRGGRIFPDSDKSTDVVEALQREMIRLGVTLRLEAPGKAIRTEDGRVTGIELQSGEVVPADALIITVGGQSFPGTGSTGDGYTMARETGHQVVDPFPALVPLKVAGVKELADLELRNVKATVVADGKATLDRQGEMRFAHFGLTGPIILYLSRHAVLAQKQGKKVEIHLNLKPALTREQLDAGLRRDWEAAPRATLAEAMKERLPERLIPFFLQAAGAEATKRVSEVTRQERNRILDTFQRWVFPVICALSKEVAEVTAGGVDLKQVDGKTMESKLVKGLYWAGEVLDVDGYIGGYNLQAAWSTGWAAGLAAARQVLSPEDPEQVLISVTR
ncbi:aminoacetone oxidase family FAD-binding enzyme [bacterium]|nr:aminoacetone oxidase family FAD-binding enzyme [bacterium]